VPLPNAPGKEQIEIAEANLRLVLVTFQGCARATFGPSTLGRQGLACKRCERTLGSTFGNEAADVCKIPGHILIPQKTNLDAASRQTAEIKLPGVVSLAFGAHRGSLCLPFIPWKLPVAQGVDCRLAFQLISPWYLWFGALEII